MRLGSLVGGLLISIIYLMDFLYLRRGLESRPCREILHVYNVCAVLCFFCISIDQWRSPLPTNAPYTLHATDNSTLLLLCTSSIF
jgi:hypothetical protein